MLHGIIKVPVTDLRAEPDAKSERVNQALFGTAVEIGEVRKDFTQVALPDKYAGWCRTGHIDQVSFALWRKYTAQPKHTVKAEIVVIRSGPGTATFPFRLYFGTRLIITQYNGETYFELPRGVVKAPISTRCLQPPPKEPRSGTTGPKVLATAMRFIGVPYLWGGISPMGFDCSGLVQTVFRFHNVALPRDSKEQQKVGFAVERGQLQPADLLFFPGHVAMSCGGAAIVHASAGRGMVTVDSLDASDSNYREDLDKEFLFARRLSL